MSADAFTYEPKTTRHFPDEVAKLVSSIVGTARELTEKSGDAKPMAFVVNSEFSGIYPMALHFRDEADKEASARAVRHFAKMLQADCVIFLCEAWGVQTNDKERSDRIVKNGGKVSEEPDRYECVMFSVETHEGVWCAMPVLVYRGKTKSFAVPEFRFMDGAEGRFMSFLPPRGATH